MALSKIEMEIIDIFHDRGVSFESMIGFTGVLKQKHAHEEMLKWLKDNPEAKHDEIFEKIFEILTSK